jgi:oxygen-independent coproporphyrinogen-3 oxidase
MCDLAVDLDAVAAPFGKSAADFEAELAALAPYREQGLVTIAGSKLVLPPSARAAVRLVASVFDRYLGKGGAVHAVAV